MAPATRRDVSISNMTGGARAKRGKRSETFLEQLKDTLSQLHSEVWEVKNELQKWQPNCQTMPNMLTWQNSGWRPPPGLGLQEPLDCNDRELEEKEVAWRQECERIEKEAMMQQLCEQMGEQKLGMTKIGGREELRDSREAEPAKRETVEETRAAHRGDESLRMTTIGYRKELRESLEAKKLGMTNRLQRRT